MREDSSSECDEVEWVGDVDVCDVGMFVGGVEDCFKEERKAVEGEKHHIFILASAPWLGTDNRN